MKLIFAFVVCLIAGSAHAQMFGAAPLSARQLSAFSGVSTPAVSSNSVSYPGCPGEVVTHTNTWYFDQALGATQLGGGTGTVAHPWKDLQALTGNNAGTPMSGYSQILLSTAPGGNGSSPVKPGDLIILNTGSYGALVLGGSTPIVNNPAITIVAGASQTPLFTTIATLEFTGIHIGDSLHQGVTVRSISTGPIQGLLVFSDNGVPHSTGDIIVENVDVSSIDVPTGDGLSKATWIADMRPGVVFQSYNDNTPSNTMSCASLVNSHVYEVSFNGLFGAVEGEAASLLVQGNEIDHYYPIGVQYDMSNVAIGHNYFHDMIQTSQGSQIYAMYNFIDASLDHTKNQSNVYIYNNKHIESVDPSQTLGPAPSSFFLNSTGDITNLVIWDNLIAASAECGVCPGNSHNYIIANNSIMYSGGIQNPEFNLSQAHAGAAGYGTGPVGNPPSNGWVFNNIGPTYNNSNGSAIQTYHNISAPGFTGFATWNYFNVWSEVFVSPTPGSMTTLPPITGEQNLIDGGVGGASPQANEFTTVACTTTAFPCSPQPDWTPLRLSPAKIAGGVTLIPPITDYNGATFAPPYSIGALN